MPVEIIVRGNAKTKKSWLILALNKYLTENGVNVILDSSVDRKEDNGLMPTLPKDIVIYEEIILRD